MSSKDGGKKKAAKSLKKESVTSEDDHKGKIKEPAKNASEGKAKSSKKGPVSSNPASKKSKK